MAKEASAIEQPLQPLCPCGSHRPQLRLSSVFDCIQLNICIDELSPVSASPSKGMLPSIISSSSRISSSFPTHSPSPETLSVPRAWLIHYGILHQLYELDLYSYAGYLGPFHNRLDPEKDSPEVEKRDFLKSLEKD